VASIRSGKRVTLKDVAKMAGVSVGMASRVLGEYGSYSETTRQRVTEAATALNYRPNRLARSLRVGSTKAIGMVVSNIRSHAWTSVIQSVEASASKLGYQVILAATSGDPATERASLRALHERSVDGIIASPTAENFDVIEDIIGDGVPLVLIGRYAGRLAAPCISIDGRGAAREATRHLLEWGHERIAIITGDLARIAGSERYQGYAEALEEAGIEVDEDLVRDAKFLHEQAYRGTLEMLELASPPTAILACNEVMAGGVLHALRDADIRIPEQMSVIGFDNPTWTRFYRPGITTVHTPHVALSTLVLNTLMARMLDPKAQAAALGERLVPTEMVVRQSTGPPPRAACTP